MTEYVRFHTTIEVPIETYRRLESYAKRFGVSVSEAIWKLFAEFNREVPFSVLDFLADLEGIKDEDLMEAIFKYFNKWFDEKYGIEMEKI